MILEWIKKKLEEKKNAKPSIQIGYIKEILQHYALMHIYQQKYAKNIRFYGGTAMRLLHGLDRLSEDIDFVSLDFDQYDELGISLEIYFRSHGYEVVAKRQSFRITLKFHNFLDQFGLAFENSNMLLLKIEISNHFNFASDYQIIPYVQKEYGTSYIAQSFRIQDLMGTKLNAVLYRSRTHEKRGASFKGRDFYDLYRYLSKKIKPTLGCIEGVESYTQLKGLLLEKIESVNFDEAIHDLEVFIENSRQAEDFRLYAKEFMIREISSW